MSQLWSKPKTTTSQLWSKPLSPLSPTNTSSNVEPSAPSPLPPRASSPQQESVRTRNPGRRFAQVVKLRPECAAAYKACHAAVWPEVLQALRRANVVDYSICHDEGSGLLFATFKYVGYDYNGDMERLAEDAKVREWWKMTDGFQESLNPGAKSTEAGMTPDSGVPSWWKGLEEVFYSP